MHRQIVKFQKQNPRNRYCRFLSIGMASLGLIFSFACNKNAAPTTPVPKDAVPSEAASGPQPVEFDACTLFNSDQAAQILGTPVRPVTKIGGCTYESANATLQGWRRQVVLNVRKYKSPAEESSAWEDFKTLRHLHPGRLNLTVLQGMGTEAYFETIPSGKLLEASVIVHNNSSDFQLKEVTDQQQAPTEALKSVAQKIAVQLQ